MALPNGIRRRQGRKGYWGTYYDGAGKRRCVQLGENLKDAVTKLNKMKHDADRIRAGLADDVSQDYPLSRLFPEYVEFVRARGKVGSRHSIKPPRSRRSRPSASESTSWTANSPTWRCKSRTAR